MSNTDSESSAARAERVIVQPPMAGAAMFSIARRELASYFNSPLAYVVICLSQLLLGLLFFEYGGFWRVGRATLEKLFEFAPFGLCLLVVPVVTMRTVAEEKSTGTLEMLITLPVRDWEVIMGKYLGALSLVLILVLSTLIYPIAMFRMPWKLGVIDMGPVLSGYLGLVLMSAAATAIGLLVSSLTRSQVIAFFITFVVLCFLVFVGMFGEKFGSTAGTVLQFISFSSNLGSFARGLIDTRAVLYFISITVFSLMIAFRALEGRKWQ
ncbi:MAG: ABC transporter permease subunit [Polyangiaceae bacterium]